MRVVNSLGLELSTRSEPSTLTTTPRRLYIIVNIIIIIIIIITIIIIIIIIIITIITIIVFHRSFSNGKSPQVSSTCLSILVDLNTAVV